MILSTDISNHFTLISKRPPLTILVAFKGRLSSKKFPEDSALDRQLILNMCLYASDHSSACKTPALYFKWLALEMEEYYQQGDLEHKLEFTGTPFFDRAICNPFKF